MKRFSFFKTTAMIATVAIVLTACATPKENTTGEQLEGDATQPVASVEITDFYGTVEVPVNPEVVIALDNRTFETLSDWGIKLAAVPKGVMPADSAYVLDDSVLDIGDHREPNLEMIAAANPDLVIVGQRFASFYEEIKALVPNAAVIDLDFDVSEATTTSGENLIKGLKNSTTALGKIFDKNEEAAQLNADFDKSIAEAKAAYNGEDTVMSLVVSGGNIGFAAPHSGRVWGPMYEIFGWIPALDVSNSTSDHQGDDVSVEAIAQSNPVWIFVLDRDAAVSSTKDAVPAQDVIDNAPALQKTTAVTEGNIVYAPVDTYTNESIQTYLELFADIAESFNK